VGFISVFGGGDADDIVLLFYVLIMFYAQFLITWTHLKPLLADEVPSLLHPRRQGHSGPPKR
jgi:hypothetical protein